MSEYQCPCCKQSVDEDDPVLYPTTARERVRMWVKLGSIKFSDKEFTAMQLAAFVETIADPEDLEEVHRTLLLKEIRDFLYGNPEIEILYRGKPGKPYVFTRRGHVISNAKAN